MLETFQYRNLPVQVRRSNRRRTVDLTVDRGGEIVISVPQALPNKQINDILKDKEVWIYQTLSKKQKVLFPKQHREFISGEGFYFLGKKYRLKVFDQDYLQTRSIFLKEGRFWLSRPLAEQGKQLFSKWYTEQASLWLNEHLPDLSKRVGVIPKACRVSNLGYRWASCGKDGILYFNWRTILLPPQKIQYIILHELVHLLEHSHGQRFYDILKRVCFDYKRHESWLKDNGDRYNI